MFKLVYECFGHFQIDLDLFKLFKTRPNVFDLLPNVKFGNEKSFLDVSKIVFD